MQSTRLLMALALLLMLACFILGCSSSKPSHSAGLATKEEEVASGDWKFRERTELPVYFKQHLQTKLKEIKKIYAEDKQNKELLVFFTDYHLEENQGYSPLLIKELDAKLPISLVVFGGDVYDNGPSVEEARQKLAIFKKRFAFIAPKMYSVVGNHEYNTSLGNRKKHPEAALKAAELKQQVVQKQFLDKTSSDAYGDYWLDKGDMRYIFLGTNPKQNIKQEQYSWLFRELEEIPNGKKVLLFSHLGCGNAKDKGAVATAMLPVTQALGALKQGKDFVWKDKTFRYGNKQVDIVGCLSGHVHKDDMAQDSGVTVVATARDALRYDPEKKQVRKPGTIGEQVLDVVVVDKAQRKVDLIRIGHGKNRSFKY